MSWRGWMKRDTQRVTRIPPPDPVAYATMVRRNATGQDGLNCSECGYDLSGLGRRGRCPECGQVFDTMSGQGLGEGAAEQFRRGERLVRRLGVAAMLVMALTALACGGVLAMFADNWRYPLATTAVIAVTIMLAAWGYYLDDSQKSPDSEDEDL